MRKTKTKIIAVVLVLSLIAALFTGIWVTVSAAKVSALTATINNHDHGGTGTISAELSGANEITVSGTVTGVKYNLILDIDPGVKVIWKANYTGSAEFPVVLHGTGTFEIAAGSTISTSAINGETVFGREAVNITISGGTVEATGKGGLAVGTSGTGTLTVTGGEIKATGENGFAIRNNNTASVTVSGGTVKTTGDYSTAIYIWNGTVMVSDGTVEATGVDSIAINPGEGNITVSGGAVEATGAGGAAIWANGTNNLVTVSDGTIKAYDAAIWCPFFGTVTVSGGAVSSSNGNAIYSLYGSVTVSGGTVEANGYNVRAIQTENGNIVISDGKVSTTGFGGTAVLTSGDGNVTISGGTVEATGNESVTVWTHETVNIVMCGGTVEGNLVLWAEKGDIIMTAGSVKGGRAVVAVNGNIAISGGTVEHVGSGGEALCTASGTIKVTGGIVKSTGVNKTAIKILDEGNGAAAYLKGTIEGDFDFYVQNNKGGIIVEVDSLIIPKSRNNTITGILITAGEGTYVWDTTAAKPFINFTLGTDNRYIEWGEYAQDQTTGTVLKGDINDDGKVNGMDLLLIKQHILDVPDKKIKSDTKAFKAADMNDDGKINGMDLLLLKKKILN